MNVPAHNGQL